MVTATTGGAGMRRVMVRYTVRPDQVEANEALVREVYDELDRTRPDGLRYATFRLDDGVSFVHVASVETQDGHNPLSAVPAFARFTETIGERTDERPVTVVLHEVGSYRFLDAAGGPRGGGGAGSRPATPPYTPPPPRG